MSKKAIVDGIDASKINLDESQIDVSSGGYATLAFKVGDMYIERVVYQDNVKGRTYRDHIENMVCNFSEDIMYWAMHTPVFKWWVDSLIIEVD